MVARTACGFLRANASASAASMSPPSQSEYRGRETSLLEIVLRASLLSAHAIAPAARARVPRGWPTCSKKRGGRCGDDVVIAVGECLRRADKKEPVRGPEVCAVGIDVLGAATASGRLLFEDLHDVRVPCRRHQLRHAGKDAVRRARSSEAGRHRSRRARPLPGARNRHELLRAPAATLTSAVAASPTSGAGVPARDG